MESQSLSELKHFTACGHKKGRQQQQQQKELKLPVGSERNAMPAWHISLPNEATCCGNTCAAELHKK